jgi:putative membrane protein
MTPPRRPVLIDIEDAAPGAPTPADAPAIVDAAPAPQGQAMQIAARLAARRMSWPARLFLSAAGALLAFVVTLAAYDYMAGLLARNAVLGWAATGLLALACLGGLALAAREAAAFSRLNSLEGLRRDAEAARAGADTGAARGVLARVRALYAARPEARWGMARLDEQAPEIMDAPALLDLAEDALLAPLDAEATREIEVAARQVATVTAFVPLALADVVAALVANLRMIRRIAEIYGGRSGVLGGWRLTKAVLAHLVATGAVAVGDDLIGSVAGGGVLSKISRRFGEGVVNGALTARVGVAAMDVCRPLPFSARPAPRITAIMGRAMRGLFDKGTG